MQHSIYDRASWIDVAQAITAKGVADGMSAAGCEAFRRVRVGSNARASLWFGVGMGASERRVAADLKSSAGAGAYEAERDAHGAAVQARLLGGGN